MTEEETATEYVVWCETHSNYLLFVGVSGMTWTDRADEARRYTRKIDARRDAERATLLDHRPIPWAVAAS